MNSTDSVILVANGSSGIRDPSENESRWNACILYPFGIYFKLANQNKSYILMRADYDLPPVSAQIYIYFSFLTGKGVWHGICRIRAMPTAFH